MYDSLCEFVCIALLYHLSQGSVGLFFVCLFVFCLFFCLFSIVLAIFIIGGFVFLVWLLSSSFLSLFHITF